MAEESTEKQPAGKQAAEEPVTYHRDRLVAESQAFFGVEPPVVVAALSQGRAANKVHFTRDEVEKLVKSTLEHVVEIDHPFPEAEEE